VCLLDVIRGKKNSRLGCKIGRRAPAEGEREGLRLKRKGLATAAMTVAASGGLAGRGGARRGVARGGGGGGVRETPVEEKGEEARLPGRRSCSLVQRRIVSLTPL
jgi:hypothetical protein